MPIFFFPEAQIENLRRINLLPEFLAGANRSSYMPHATLESRDALGIKNNE